MNLKKLKEIIDFYCENLNPYTKPEDISVLIDLSENSVGAIASSSIVTAYMGIDWEHNQLRLSPSKQLVTKGSSSNDVKHIICETIEGRNYYWCPTCPCKIAKDDKYCRSCGQKLK